MSSIASSDEHEHEQEKQSRPRLGGVSKRVKSGIEKIRSRFHRRASVGEHDDKQHTLHSKEDSDHEREQSKGTVSGPQRPPRRRVVSLSVLSHFGHSRHRQIASEPEPRALPLSAPSSPPRRRTTSSNSSHSHPLLSRPSPRPIALTFSSEHEDSSVSDSTSVHSAHLAKQPLDETTVEPLMSAPEIVSVTAEQAMASSTLLPDPSSDLHDATAEPSSMTAASPPTVEPEGPNPFLVDDPEEPVTPSEPPTARPSAPGFALSDSQSTVAPAEVISLSTGQTPPIPPAANLASPPLNVHKPVPPAPVPTSDTEESESEAPAVYLPQLVLPTMFLPIPNVRIRSLLTWWYTKRPMAIIDY